MRGNGIGTELITKAIEHAKLIGINQLSLSVESNNPARALYRRFKFKKVAVVDNSWTMTLLL